MAATAQPTSTHNAFGVIAKRYWIWIAINAFLMAADLLFERSLTIPQPNSEEVDIFHVIALWLTRAGPIFAVVTLGNIVWLFFLLKKADTKREWRAYTIWLLVMGIWLVVLSCYGIGILGLKLEADGFLK